MNNATTYLLNLNLVPGAIICVLELLHVNPQCTALCGFNLLVSLNRTVLLAKAKSRTLELLAFDEYCRFDTSAFFMRIKRGSLIYA